MRNIARFSSMPSGVSSAHSSEYVSSVSEKIMYGRVFMPRNRSMNVRP